MKLILSVFILYFKYPLFAQDKTKNKIVITGVRFAYPLVEKWMEE